MPGPFNFQAELSALQSKQKLAEAMRSAAMSGQLRTGGGLGGLVTALMRPGQIDRMERENLDAQAALQGRYKAELGNELQNYLTTRQGQAGRGENMYSPQEVAAAGGDAGVPQLAERPAVPAIPADPRKAAVGAFASQFPQLQELGKSDLAGMGKNALTPKDVMGFSGMDPKTKILAAQLVSAGIPETQVLGMLRPELKEHVVNGQILRATDAGGYGTVADARDQYGNVGPVAQGPHGPIYGQANRGTGEVKFAPAGTNVNVNTAQRAGERFAGAIAENRAGELKESYKNAQSAVKSLSALDDASQQLNAGIKSGSLASLDLALGKLGETFGVQRDATNANTEVYAAAIANQVAQYIRNLGTGTAVSDNDLKFALRAVGGDPATSAAALREILGMAKTAATNVLFEHQRIYDAQKGATGVLPQDLETFHVPFSVSAGTEAAPEMRYNPLSQRMGYVKPPAAKPAVPGAQPVRKLTW